MRTQVVARILGAGLSLLVRRGELPERAWVTDPSHFGVIRPSLVDGSLPFGEGVRARVHGSTSRDYRKAVTQS